MPEAPAAPLPAEAYTWYAAALHDLVQELLEEAGLDIAGDTVDDLCADLWLHATEFTATRTVSFAELLDLLDRNAGLLVNRLHFQSVVIPVGRLDTAVDTVDVAELAAGAVDSSGYRSVPRPRRPATSSVAFEFLGALRPAA